MNESKVVKLRADQPMERNTRIVQLTVGELEELIAKTRADKGGEKPYRLVADAIVKSGRLAIAELVSRGKEQLVLVRPYRKGLVLHTMY